MEVVGSKRIFMRSKDFHRLQYTQYLGDGDSKSYTIVYMAGFVSNPYKGKSMEKLDWDIVLQGPLEKFF